MVDPELMDMLSADLKTAAHGLPVTFKPVPSDVPIFLVRIADEDTGSLINADGKWHSVSTVVMKVDIRDTLRAALAAHINRYVDSRIGLV